MARDVILAPPNRGLNIVSKPSLLLPGQTHRAENCVFTRTSVKRRRGRRAAYIYPTSVQAAVTFLKRYYRLATSGAIGKFVVAAITGDTKKFYYQTSSNQWSDDTATAITAAWLTLNTPNTTDNTLYFRDSAGYSSTQITFTDGNLKHSLISNGWLYVWPDNATGDDAAKTVNVPMRTKCDKYADGDEAFLHGLVPPNPLDIDDTEDTLAGTLPTFSTSFIAGGTNNVSFGVCIARHTDGKIHVVFEDDSSGTLEYSSSDDSGATWIASEQIKGAAVIAKSVSLALDSGGNPHVSYCLDGGAGNEDLEYATKFVDDTTWTTETVDSTVDCNDSSIAINSTGDPYIAYHDSSAGNGALKVAFKVGAGSWTQETADTATSTNVGDYCSAVFDSSGNLHISYRDTTGAALTYIRRTGAATYDAAEVVDTVAASTGWFTSITLDSSDVPAIAYFDATNAAQRFAYKSGGTWSVTEDVESGIAAVGGTIGDKYIVFDSSNNPQMIYYDGGLKRMRYSKKSGGSWSNFTADDYHDSGIYGGMVIDSDNDVHMAYGDAETGDVLYTHGDIQAYHYKLTAEYDDGILGESGPSAATGVSLVDDIDSSNTHSIVIGTNASDRYDMTKDVTRIHVYRTVKGAGSTGTYFRAGSVDCTAGVPGADFTDNVPDIDLVDGVVLDEDVYLPPKYKTAVMWKDRLVIGNTKARDTSDSTVLDYGETADASTHKNRIRFSKAYLPDIFKELFFQDILPDGDSGSIRRLIVNKGNDTLYIFMENDAVALTDPIGDLDSSLSFRSINVRGAHGTPAPDSVLEYEGKIFYWTKWGIEVIDGYRARNISSDTIGGFWNMLETTHPRYADRINMGQISQVNGAVHVDSAGERIIWSYPAAASAYKNRVLVLDYARWRDSGFQDDGVFSIHSGWNVGPISVWDGEGDRSEIFCGESFSSLSPWIYRIYFGDREEIGGVQSSTITPSVVPPMIVHYGLTHAGNPNRLKAWKACRIEASCDDSADSTNVKLIFDPHSGAVVTLDTQAWTASAYPQRMARAIPHTNISHFGGIRVESTDTAVNQRAFEIFAASLTLEDVKTRVRGGLLS